MSEIDEKQPVENADQAEVKKVPGRQEALDPGNQALADALRKLFVLLKVCIVFVVVLFFYGGMYKVQQNERAVVLRFGKLVGAGSSAIREPGWHWGWPYLEEVVKIPAGTNIRKLDVDDFWYYMTDQEKATGKPGRVPSSLQFVLRDGYSLTASQGAAQGSSGSGEEVELAGASGIDYNLVHTRWQIQYLVSDPLDFVSQVWDGRSETWWSVDKLLRNLLSDAVIRISAQNDIEWMVWGNREAFREQIEREVLARLEKMELGLMIKQLVLLEISVPRQVQQAFDQANSARSQKQELISQAMARADEIRNEAEAEAMNIRARAQAYRDTVVNEAEADALYLEEVIRGIQEKVAQRVPDGQTGFEQERKRQFGQLLAVTVDELYQEMLRDVIDQADEVIVPATGQGKESELRIHLSRDPSVKPRSETMETKQR